jgi:hypothetical protein
MALTDEQRGTRAAWLRRHRIARFGSGQGGLAALSEELRVRGAFRGPETIKGWEASDDRSPIPVDVVPHLVEIFGDPYPAPLKPVTTADLVAALAAQTQAITELIALVRPLVAESGESIEARLRSLETAARLRVPEGDAARRGRSAPRATTGS